MRAFTGFLIFIAAIAVLHANASSETMVHCQPVLAPPPPNCHAVLGVPFGKLPLECNRT